MSSTTYATSAPLLGALRSKGSTFYTISSALNDIDKTQMNSNYVMAPSKFVCLNLPQWRNRQDLHAIYENPENIGEPLQTDPNIIIPKIIQNYIENALCVTSVERTDETLQTLAESLFWKMMVRLGALKFKRDGEILANGSTLPVYAEDVESYPDKSPLVVYAGDINVLNHVTKMGQSYTEIFMHVPTQSTLLENIRFTLPDATLTTEQVPVGGGPEYTIGLEDHVGANVNALYDTVDKKYDFTPNSNHGVYFDELFTSVEDKDKIDGKDFEFNVVLVYYDIWNREQPSTRKTNLYGILFIDSFKDTGAGSSKIETLNKYTPDAVTTGNGYAIRLNIKTTSNQAQTTSEISINDYSSVSMELYMDALRRLNNVTDLYEQQQSYFYGIQTRVDQIFASLPRLAALDGIVDRVAKLEELLKTNQTDSRISNEDLFECFREVAEATKTYNKSVNVQMMVGNYMYDPSSGAPIVVDPNNNRWKWNSLTQQWDKML